MPRMSIHGGATLEAYWGYVGKSENGINYVVGLYGVCGQELRSPISDDCFDCFSRCFCPPRPQSRPASTPAPESDMGIFLHHALDATSSELLFLVDRPENLARTEAYVAVSKVSGLLTELRFSPRVIHSPDLVAVESIRKPENACVVWAEIDFSNQHTADILELMADDAGMPRIITAPLDKKRDIYRVLNRDQCRDLHVVRKNVDSIAELTEGEWRNIRILADATESKQKEENERRNAAERKNLEAGFLQRKAEFDCIEAEQDVNPLEEEVKREKQETSKQLRAQVETENLETDDTVRFFNDSLNSALVRAVRDRQVLKRQQIKLLAEQEEFRVDSACRKDTNLGFTIGQKMEEHRHDEDMRYGAMLKDQLRCKEEERMMDKESQAAEGRRALQYARRLQHQEVEDNIKQTEERRTVTRALIAENNKALDAKKDKKLQDIRMDHALAKSHREKLAEEDRRDALKKEDKRQRELAFAEELSKQKRSTDLKAIEDEKKAQRAVYQSDRDWRLAETTKTIKHMREQEELKKIIDYQREVKLRKNAFEVEAEKKIFDETQERLVSEAKKAEELKASQLAQRRANAILLRQQIAAREKERWLAVQEGWNLGSTTRQDMQAHDKKVEMYMEQKMKQAEAAGIPASYLKDVLRHMSNSGYLPKQESRFQALQNRDQVRKIIRHFA